MEKLEKDLVVVQRQLKLDTKTVYIAFEKDYSGGEVHGIFSSKVLAWQFIRYFAEKHSIPLDDKFFVGTYFVDCPLLGREVECN